MSKPMRYGTTGNIEPIVINPHNFVSELMAYWEIAFGEMIREQILPTSGEQASDEACGDDMPGMTLEEFQAWSDQIIREVKG